MSLLNYLGSCFREDEVPQNNMKMRESEGLKTFGAVIKSVFA